MDGCQTPAKVLALDIAGNPNAWIDIERAVHLIATDRVLARLGVNTRLLLGGINARTGQRSQIEISSILLTRMRVQPRLWTKQYQPPLTNRALFARDGHVCQYCGDMFPTSKLTRDHIVPVSRGGRDIWSNVTTACAVCNAGKGARTPEEWGVQLIAVPYTPCYAEHLLLKGRNILADQAAFLQARVRRMKTG